MIFLSRLAAEDGAFAAGDVVEGIAAKMVRRHPHVFGDATARDAAEVLVRWEEIKKSEKAAAGNDEANHSVLAGIPKALPSLVTAQRLGAKAARVGFDWRADDDAVAKLEEETAELRRAVDAGDRGAVREEIGDALFTLAMLARRLDVDADEALARANTKFRERFRHVEKALLRDGVSIETAGLALLDRLWNEAKAFPPRPETDPPAKTR